ncbi:MAG: paraquat-inducible protein A [Cellvibrionaceae bacterium]|nr:paraquat-inducible protein A [Cellvibrionaceae bacterium]
MSQYPVGTAAAAGLLACHVCSHLSEQLAHSQRCSRCGAQLELRKRNSLQRCLAFLLTACVLYIPANLLPIMITTDMGQDTANTIVSGVIQLWGQGEYPVAMIIFVASVLVPVIKIMAIVWLCYLLKSERRHNLKQLSQIYDWAELIGKWSMVDVFVVALLVALVQLGSFMAVKPGSAALAFAGVVIFTMLSARAFDSRLIWDKEASGD